MASGQIRSLAVALAGAALMATAAVAAQPGGAPLDRSGFKPIFSAEFDEADGKLDLWSPDNPMGVWKSDYYFGAQRDRRDHRPGRDEQFIARTIPGELQVYVDEAYCGRDPFKLADGRLRIEASRLSVADAVACSQGKRAYASGLITTQKSLRQTYGYFEARVKVPDTWGTWSAFWLLPVESTPANAGRLPEIDVFEHYAGPHPTVQIRPGVPLDRTGQANITVHTGVKTAEQMQRPPAQPRVTTTGFHTYGVLWTASELVFYLDDVETWRTPFRYSQPMYMLLNLAVSDKTAGNPAFGEYPAALEIDYVRAWTTP